MLKVVKTRWIVYDWELDLVVGVYESREHAFETKDKYRWAEVIEIRLEK